MEDGQKDGLGREVRIGAGVAQGRRGAENRRPC
jgi:hypothetical protein